MKNKLLIMITFLLLINSNSWAQEKSEEIEYPNFYSTITIGAMEFFSFSVGKYLTNDIAVAAKFSLFMVESSGSSGSGLSGARNVGLGINYFFKKLFIFRYLSADYLITYSSSYEGYGLEATIGNCTNREKGFGFVYEFGIGYSDVIAEYSYPQFQRKILRGAVIKIGWNYNL